MDQTSAEPKIIPGYRPVWKAILVLVTALVFGAWLLLTPSGLLGKADAAGYAVCHRIDARSFHLGERQTPLCARCSGMYLGALLGLVYLSRFGKRAGMPARKVLIVLGLFLVLFGLDGINSYLHFFPGITGLYEPANSLRLITGTGLGLGIAAVLVPVLHQTLWPVYDNRPALAGWREFLPLLGLAALLDLAIWSELPPLLYPLALLSGASIFVLLTIVYGVVWTLITKRENRYLSYRQIWPALTAGFLTAVVQTGLIDAGRYWLTGTWSGFNF
jgi:uncharacterized membrane protein